MGIVYIMMHFSLSSIFFSMPEALSISPSTFLTYVDGMMQILQHDTINFDNNKYIEKR